VGKNRLDIYVPSMSHNAADIPLEISDPSGVFSSQLLASNSEEFKDLFLALYGLFVPMNSDILHCRLGQKIAVINTLFLLPSLVLLSFCSH